MCQQHQCSNECFMFVKAQQFLHFLFVFFQNNETNLPLFRIFFRFFARRKRLSEGLFAVLINRIKTYQRAESSSQSGKLINPSVCAGETHGCSCSSDKKKKLCKTHNLPFPVQPFSSWMLPNIVERVLEEAPETEKGPLLYCF